MIAISFTSITHEIGRGLFESLYMFFETFWALVLGFGLSGAVQAFVPRDAMRKKLGGHRPSHVVRASGYGMASSSCSYAASAMAKSLFAKGADFTSSMIFMVASTNLVIELGLVLLVLMGWQFTLAEFVGGSIMISLLALVGSMAFTATLVSVARKRLRDTAPEVQAPARDADSSPPITTLAGWSDAASYAVADVTMLRKELIIGYGVAGFLAALVPMNLWSDLFLHGHGVWSSIENALIGPLIAVMSWVCSVGNVPLAAALWSGGISFGGVIAFIFADLITMPLLLIYRRYYGGKLTLRIFVVFYLVMATTGLIVGALFGVLHLVPQRHSLSPSADHFSWNYTTVLNIAFLVIGIVLWWLARHQERLGGGVGYTIDPVCHMQVRTRQAPAHTAFRDRSYYFCSDHCLHAFEADPQRYLAADLPTPMDEVAGAVPISLGSVIGTAASRADVGIDPMCGMTVRLDSAAAERHRDGLRFVFCNPGCADRFDQLSDIESAPHFSEAFIQSQGWSLD